jgi:hypothetical protein
MAAKCITHQQPTTSRLPISSSCIIYSSYFLLIRFTAPPSAPRSPETLKTPSSLDPTFPRPVPERATGGKLQASKLSAGRMDREGNWDSSSIAKVNWNSIGATERIGTAGRISRTVD